MDADRDPQNIYDDPRFFAGYSQLERFGAGWTKALEHPSLMGLLPDVAGQRVLELARSERAHPRVTYLRAAIENLAFPPERFELVVSSLALHYVEDYSALLRSVASWLVSASLLVYSTEHPVYTARDPADGWVLDGQGKRLHWALDDYAEEG